MRHEEKLPVIIVHLVILSCKKNLFNRLAARAALLYLRRFSHFLKNAHKIKQLGNKQLIRRFGVWYCWVFLLIVCILTRLAGSSQYVTSRKIIADTTRQNF